MKESTEEKKQEPLNDIYDRMFKKVLTLSGRAVTSFINGLFGTDYPPDSRITYNWTEFEDDKLRKTLADTILTVNGENSYHIEAQMTKDNGIVLRMFSYGYGHAEHTRRESEAGMELIFPEPKVIYLYAEGEVPEEYELKLNFGTQGSFVYRVPVLRLQGISAEELDQRRMVILIPFFLLKLRKKLQEKRNPESLEELKHLVRDVIMVTIEGNRRAGNLTWEDAAKLREMTKRLFDHLYAGYKEVKEEEIMDQSLILDADIYEKEIEERDGRIAVLEKENQRIAVLEKENQRIAVLERENQKGSRQISALQQELEEKERKIAEYRKMLGL